MTIAGTNPNDGDRKRQMMTGHKLAKNRRLVTRFSSLSGAVLALCLIAAAPVENPLSAGAKPLAAADQATELDAISSYLENIQSLQAGFIQEGPDGSTAEGNMHLKRPGKLRFDYGDNSSLLLVSDGSILSFVDYDVKQVTRWPISDTPLNILVARHIDLKKDYKISRMVAGDGLLKLTIKDPKHMDQGFITLIFDKAPLELRAWEVTDQQGQKTRLTLMNPVKNTDQKDDLFTFKDPRAQGLTGKRRH
jgi:chaperone LolA